MVVRNGGIMLKVKLKDYVDVDLNYADSDGYFEAKWLSGDKLLVCVGKDEYGAEDCDMIVSVSDVEDIKDV